MTLLIDAYKVRDVGTYDVPGAFLQAGLVLRPNNERALMRLVGESVGIMYKVNPEYMKNVVCEKGKKVLYLSVLQAVYGCIKSALLWHELFAGTLQKIGYRIKFHDKCVVNRVINGKQYMITWYVNDKKSHVDKNVGTRDMERVTDFFGELVISKGNKLDNLSEKI